MKHVEFLDLVESNLLLIMIIKGKTLIFTFILVLGLTSGLSMDKCLNYNEQENWKLLN